MAERWRTLSLASGVAFVETVLFAALAPLLPTFEDRLGLSKVGAGGLTAAYALGAFGAALPSIAVARRVGVKATGIAGLTVLGVASVVFALAGHVELLFAARLLQGIGSALAYTGTLAWMVATVPVARRAEAIGIAFSAAFAGALVGPLLGALAEAAGITTVFLGVAAAAFGLGGVACALATPEPIRGTIEVRSLATDRFVVLNVWLIALAGLLLGVLSVLVPLRLDTLGWGAARIGALFALGAVVQAAINPGLGRLSDRRGHAVPLRIALGGSAATSGLLVLRLDVWEYGLVAMAAGVAYGALWTPAMAWLADAVEGRGADHVVGFGLMNAAWAPGFATGAAGGAALAALLSDAVPYLVAALMCLASLALLGGRTGKEGSVTASLLSSDA